MIAAEGLSFDRGARGVIRDVTLVLEPGAVTVAVGPNGAGKSTLLKLLSGELAPRRGTVRLGGRPLGSIPVRTLARMRAVVPQAGAPAFALSVHEIVRLGAEAGGARDPDAAAEAALASVGLAGWGGRSAAALSGGERQRVNVARALAQVAHERGTEPSRVLLLDEPTSNLDLAHQIGVLDRARRFARAGGTVFLVLHDLNLAAEFADRVVVLRAGRVAAVGPPSRALFETIAGEVYSLPGAASRLPPGEMPFVLPQARFR